MSASREKKHRKVDTSPAVKSNKKVDKDREERRKNNLYRTAAIVLVVVLIAAVGIAVYQGVIAPGMAVAKIGGEKIYAHEVNFYYLSSYDEYINTYSDYLSMLGLDTSASLRQQAYYADTTMTWHDYFTEAALYAAQQIRMLANSARAAGVKLSDENADLVYESMETFRIDVEENTDMTLDEYLKALYGNKMTESEYKRLISDGYLAQQYVNVMADSFTYTDDQMSTYYTENKNALDVYTFRAYFVENEVTSEMTEDETAAAKEAAHNKAQEIADQSKNEQGFLQQVVNNYVPEETEDGTEPAEYTTVNADQDTLLDSMNYENLKYYFATTYTWIIDEARTAGEFGVVDTDSGTFVIMFKSREREDYNTIDVRHLLVRFELDTDATEPTAAQDAAAKARAEELLAEWKAGDATEESFAALATENTDDSGSATTGGLYEKVYKNQMVTNFNLWCFTESRKPGDTGIVSSEYGYHIMYFVGQNEIRWIARADEAMRERDYNAWQSEQLLTYEIEGGLDPVGVGLYGDR